MSRRGPAANISALFARLPPGEGTLASASRRDLRTASGRAVCFVREFRPSHATEQRGLNPALAGRRLWLVDGGPPTGFVEIAAQRRK